MNVQELIAELECMNPETEVKFAYNYGDHWSTTVASEISSIQEEDVVRSEYHRMDKVVEDTGDLGEDEQDGIRTVVILSNNRF